MQHPSASGTQAFRLAAHQVHESLAWEKLFLTRANQATGPSRWDGALSRLLGQQCEIGIQKLSYTKSEIKAELV